MRILLIDNYDSFTYNLVHMLEMACGQWPDVHRNDALPEFDPARWNAVVVSPGPGLPVESGRLLPYLRQIVEHVPVLGICLGHQALFELYGGALRQLPEVMHGVSKTCRIEQPQDFLFEGLPNSFVTGHYHSWVADESRVPASLRVTARDEAGIIQAFSHKSLNIKGLQFHPESVLTPEGYRILCNWVKHLG